MLRHTYAALEGGGAFERTVTARIGAETRAAAVVVTPRFRVTQYRAQLTTVNNGDSALEGYTEWRIVRRGGSLPDKTWEFDQQEPGAWIGDYPQQTHPLPDSVVSFDLTATETRVVDYRVTEVDPIFDDLGQTGEIELDPLLGNRTVVLLYDWDADGCKARIQADVEVRLLTPGLGTIGGGPVASP